MNKYVIILLAFLFINGASSLIGYLVPTLPGEKVFPIISWIKCSINFSIIVA